MQFKMFCLIKILLATFVAMLLLSLFTFAYKFTPVRVVDSDDATDYRWKSFSCLNTMEEGLAFIRMDANGYNNTHPKSLTTYPDILLMGSSHMLAIEVRDDENVGYLLNEMTPYTVYNIGMAGHFLNTSISNLKDAIDIYSPQKYVIIETDTLELTNDDIELVLSDNYPMIESNTNPAINLAQSICPASKKLIAQITAWRDSEKKDKGNYINKMPDTLLFNRYFDRIVENIGNLHMIIVYNPKTILDENGNLLDNGDFLFRYSFAKVCKSHDITFIDMTSDYQQLYSNQHILAHGFVNTAVGKGHLNRFGHQVIAARLAEVIEEER